MSRNGFWKRLRALAVVLAAISVSRCAALTVDVDVYRGSLSNTEHVQAEIVASAAIAAKPLLVALRDRLEWPEDLVGNYRGASWYAQGHIASSDEPGAALNPIQDARARNVNEILGLYEDRTLLSAEFARIKDAEAQRSAASAMGAPDTDSVGVALAALNKVPAGDAALAALARAYRAYVEGIKAQRDYGKEIAVYEAHLVLQAALGSEETLTELQQRLLEFDVRKALGLTTSTASIGTVTTSANVRLETLEVSGLVDVHAGVLFPTDPRARKALAAVIRRRTSWYSRSRKALLELLLGGIDLVLATARVQPNELIDGRSVEQIQGDGISLILSTFHPRYFAAGLWFMKNSGENLPPQLSLFGPDAIWADLGESYLALMVEGSGSDVDTNTYKQKFVAAKAALGRELREDPVNAARLVLFVHSALGEVNRETRAFDQASAIAAGWRYMLAPGRLKYGIALALAVTDDVHAVTDDVQAPTQPAVPKAVGAGPLAGGRRAKGLDTLIRQYTESAALGHYRGGEDGSKAAELLHQLLDALVRFSTKILMMANHQTLFEVGEIEGRIPGLLNDAKNELLGSGSKRPDAGEYVTILQAIGNSTLAQVDDLVRRMDFNERRYIYTEGLRSALARVGASGVDWTLNPSEVLEQMELGLEAKIQEYLIGAEPPASTDEPDARPKGHRESEYYKDMETAIERIRDLKKRTAYVRSAGSILKEAMAPTTLAQDSALTRTNMLAEHAMRQWPTGELDGRTREAMSRTLQELDKQKWQNVNRVAVRAVGNTSYVLVKDDVGNWYVKSYEGDPGPVIRAAKNAAIGQATAGLSEDLVARAQRESEGRGDDVPKSVKEGQFTGERQRYQQGVSETLKSLQSAAMSLPDRVKGVLAANSLVSKASKAESLVAAIDTAKKAHLDSVTTASVPTNVSPTDASGDGRKWLGALRSFFVTARSAVDQAELTSSSDKLVSDAETKLKGVQTKIAGARAALAGLRGVLSTPTDPNAPKDPNVSKLEQQLADAYAEAVTAEQEISTARAQQTQDKTLLKALQDGLAAMVKADFDSHLGRLKQAAARYKTGLEVIGGGVK